MKYPQVKICAPYQASPVEKTDDGESVINPIPYVSETYKLIGSSPPFDGELLTSPSIADLVIRGAGT